MARSIEGFKYKITAMTFSNGISKVSDSKMQETDINVIMNQINSGELSADIIKAIVSDDVIYPEKKAICAVVEKSNMTLYDMYLSAYKEVEININDLYKAEPYLSEEYATDLRLDIVMHKAYHNEPISAQKADVTVDENTLPEKDAKQTTDDIEI